MAGRHSFEKILFIPDTHVPFHDKRAFLLACKIARSFRPDWLVVLGDFADFYSVSKHDRSPDRRHLLIEEVDAVKEALDELSAAARCKRRIYVSGNHEFRFDRYIKTKAPDLFGLTSCEEILGLEERGWQWVPYHDYVRIGKLMVTHDTGACGMNAHRRSLASAGSGKSAVIGHTHRMSYEVKHNSDGSMVTAAMFGWLGDAKQIDYTHKTRTNDWVHGVGLGYKFSDGTVILQPVPFFRNRAVVNGKVISLDAVSSRNKFAG